MDKTKHKDFDRDLHLLAIYFAGIQKVLNVFFEGVFLLKNETLSKVYADLWTAFTRIVDKYPTELQAIKEIDMPETAIDIEYADPDIGDEEWRFGGQQAIVKIKYLIEQTWLKYHKDFSTLPTYKGDLSK